MVEAAGQRIGARRAREPGVHARVLERDRGELGERLERVEVLLGGADAAPVGDREHAAQLPAPVHGHGHRRLDPRPGRAGRRAPDALVVVGHHRAVLEQHLAGEPGAGRHAEADLLGRQPVRRLDGELVGVRDAVDDRGVGADQRRGLVADAAEQGGEVERLVQGLGGARERGVVERHTAVLDAGRLVGERGRGGGGECERELERLLAEQVVVARGKRQDVGRGGGEVHDQDRGRGEADADLVRERQRGLPPQPRVVGSGRGERRRRAERRHRDGAQGAARARDARRCRRDPAATAAPRPEPPAARAPHRRARLRARPRPAARRV